MTFIASDQPALANNVFFERASATPPKRICVAGGAGFLGSHLCERLVGDGHSVVALDNFHTGGRENVAHLLSTGRLVVVDHDITRPFPSGLAPFDEIYNLACPASPVHYQSDPVYTLDVCATGTRNLLERAAFDGARFFHASTSEVYGDPEMHPQRESYWGNVNTLGPRACYDEGKRFAETLVMELGRQRAVPVRIVRIFNTYGPRMQLDDGRVVSNFVIQALKGEPLTIYGDGAQTRSFCYVDDLIDGFVRLMAANGAFVGPVNLGNPNEITMVELASEVLRLTGSRSRLIRLPLPQDDPKRRRPDIALARRLLGWAPTVSLERGLGRTVEYFRSSIDREPTKATGTMAYAERTL